MTNFIAHWPASTPEYKWPAWYLSPPMVPVRLLLAGVFHVAHALGRVWNTIRPNEAAALIIRTDGIGDMLLFEPAIESLARNMSPAEIHVWAPRGALKILKAAPTVHRRSSVPRGGKSGNLRYFFSLYWRARMGFQLGRWTFEKAIYTVQSPEPLGNWLLTSARANARWYSPGDTINQFDEQQLRTRAAATEIVETRPGNAHEIIRNRYLIDQWDEKFAHRTPRVATTTRATESAEIILEALRTRARSIEADSIIGVVIAGTSKVNRYPTDQWVDALTQLWNEHRVIGVLIGGPGDHGMLKELSARLGTLPHLRVPRFTSLLTTSALIGKLDGMISIDTGLAHIALSQRIPTVVISAGGTPGRFFPWPNAPHHEMVNVEMPCDGCFNRCSQPEPFCVTRISSNEIVEAYMRVQGPRITLEVLQPAATRYAKSA